MERNNLLEKYVVDFCSPTLASIKTAGLINCYFMDGDKLKREMKELNSMLRGKGVEIEILRNCKKSVLIYVYRKNKLAKDLQQEGVAKFLSQYGYTDIDVESALSYLKKRLENTDGFPHEIGAFLGYPLGDVKGFIQNEGKNFKCCGCWKVYCDKCEAERKFAQYDKCRRIYLQQWQNGKSVLKLTVAA